MEDSFRSWNGSQLALKVLYSKAGVAQQIMVENNSGILLIDVGDGTLRDLRDKHIDRNKILAVLITHGHFDHMGGLFTLLGYLRMIGRTENLPVIVPIDCEEVKAVTDIFDDIYGDTIPFQIPVFEAGPDETFNIGDMSIETFEMVHHGSISDSPVLDRIPALGYRISCKGETIAISGDTGDCRGLRDMVTDVDLAVIEATYADSSSVSNEELEKIHLSEDIAIQIGALAKNYILVHKGRR